MTSDSFSHANLLGTQSMHFKRSTGSVPGTQSMHATHATRSIQLFRSLPTSLLIGGTTLVTIEGQSPQILIKKISWEVRAGAGGERVAQIGLGRSTTKRCRRLDAHQLAPLLGEPSTTTGVAGFPLVCMLEDDNANYEACRLARTL